MTVNYQIKWRWLLTKDKSDCMYSKTFQRQNQKESSYGKLDKSTLIPIQTFIYFTTITQQFIHTPYINHARWHRCLRSGGLLVGRNGSTRRKPTCPTWWPHDISHMRRWVSNLIEHNHLSSSISCFKRATYWL